MVNTLYRIRVESILVWCHVAICSFVYKAQYPYVTRGPDESYYELHLCRPPTLSVRTVTICMNVRYQASSQVCSLGMSQSERLR